LRGQDRPQAFPVLAHPVNQCDALPDSQPDLLRQQHLIHEVPEHVLLVMLGFLQALELLAAAEEAFDLLDLHDLLLHSAHRAD